MSLGAVGQARGRRARPHLLRNNLALAPGRTARRGGPKRHPQLLAGRAGGSGQPTSPPEARGEGRAATTPWAATAHTLLSRPRGSHPGPAWHTHWVSTGHSCPHTQDSPFPGAQERHIHGLSPRWGLTLPEPLVPALPCPAQPSVPGPCPWSLPLRPGCGPCAPGDAADSREHEEQGAGADQQRGGSSHGDVLGGFEARPGAAGHPGRRAAASLPGA